MSYEFKTPVMHLPCVVTFLVKFCFNSRIVEFSAKKDNDHWLCSFVLKKARTLYLL